MRAESLMRVESWAEEVFPSRTAASFIFNGARGPLQSIESFFCCFVVGNQLVSEWMREIRSRAEKADKRLVLKKYLTRLKRKEFVALKLST